MFFARGGAANRGFFILISGYIPLDSLRRSLVVLVAFQFTMTDKPREATVTQTTAIALPENATGLTTDVRTLVQQIEELKKVAILLLPVTQIDFIAPCYGVSKRVVVIDTNPEAGEVYAPPEQPGRLALTKLGLEKLDQAAGIDWIRDSCRRTDNGNIEHYAHYEVAAKVQQFDGTWKTSTASKEVDLRDGSAQVKGMTANQLAAARKHVNSLAETKAENRCRREMMGLKSSYHPKELEKPFVVFKLVPAPDMNDPDVKRIVVQNALGIKQELFGPSAPPVNITPKAIGPETEPPVTAAQETQPKNPFAKDEAPPTQAPPSPISPEEQIRLNQIARVEDLYLRKKGKTRAELSPAKPPLADLTSAQLLEIEVALNSLPDLTELL